MDFFSTLLGIYALLVGIWLLILVITLIVIYKRRDMRKPEKVFWTVVIIMAPVLGLVAYLVWGRKRQAARNQLTDLEVNHPSKYNPDAK